MRPTITPTGRARTFDREALIVSKTDLKGHITYANPLFAEVAAYPMDELLGSPHSMVRHPEMPRGIFHLLWERVKADREIFAYVVNLAADGAHYWVIAHVTPSHGPDGRITGYHSNRRWPHPEAVRRVQQVYAQMRDVERGIPRASDAAKASAAWLDAELAARGTSYDEFVWDLITSTRTAAA